MIIFNIIGKKKNQTSVSAADWEIPTLGSTDNAGNLVSGISVYPQVGISRSVSVIDVRFILSQLLNCSMGDTMAW